MADYPLPSGRPPLMPCCLSCWNYLLSTNAKFTLSCILVFSCSLHSIWITSAGIFLFSILFIPYESPLLESFYFLFSSFHINHLDWVLSIFCSLYSIWITSAGILSLFLSLLAHLTWQPPLFLLTNPATFSCRFWQFHATFAHYFLPFSATFFLIPRWISATLFQCFWQFHATFFHYFLLHLSAAFCHSMLHFFSFPDAFLLHFQSIPGTFLPHFLLIFTSVLLHIFYEIFPCTLRFISSGIWFLWYSLANLANGASDDLAVFLFLAAVKSLVCRNSLCVHDSLRVQNSCLVALLFCGDKAVCCPNRSVCWGIGNLLRRCLILLIFFYFKQEL